ncbi:STAS domain-containing protein [Aliidiomarina sanyensis]|uniref:Anti-sigma factor antagonist n=1 Tax=Aliidiomarina sanyensis TaxID=1249555 RepID=A0A432WNA4_9GAMM|nr:STAS domain-containing protein [Aliidiomarina sanyensis]RUO35273.1 anti-sigma factor antagonist [Aliidiomarina sanyensis]
MSLLTEFANDGKQFVIHVKGKFDFGMVHDFRQSYEGLTERVSSVVVDFRETEYIDSSALGMLLNMRKSLGAGTRTIHLINCRPEVRKILDISRFDKLFVIE